MNTRPVGIPERSRWEKGGGGGGRSEKVEEVEVENTQNLFLEKRKPVVKGFAGKEISF